MNNRNALSLALLLCLSPVGLAIAQRPPPPSTPVVAADRQAVVQALTAQLHANYVFPEVASRVAIALEAKEASGGYAGAATVGTFSAALAKDLRELGQDGHFQVRYDPDFRRQPDHTAGPPSKEDVELGREAAGKRGYGIPRVERLAGNIGYMEVRGFGPTELVGDAFTAAMVLLSGSDALILDLRRNGGGEPSSVAHLMSHFFAHGDERHLNDIYTRPGDTTRQYWTNPAVSVRYTKPVYVLTSARTFSGGEECAYDFQTQKRATLVGEVTGGGANPGDRFALANGFVAFIPTGKAINPVTKTNWEHVGVKPDIEVPAAQAQQTAHVAILRRLLAQATDLQLRENLQAALGTLENDPMSPPD